MRILHLNGHSLTRLTPARMACYWGRYTEHEGRAAVIDRPGGPRQNREGMNPYGLLCAEQGKYRRELMELVRWADVLQFHDDAYPPRLGAACDRKVMAYLAHIGDLPERLFSGKNSYWKYDDRVGHACITNGYGRFFDAAEERAAGRVVWHRLPDVLDIWHPTMRPRPELRPKRLRVMFSYSNKRERGEKINAKCPIATKQILDHVPGVEVRYCYRQSFEQCMSERQAAHVVVDDVFSPYTHLGALEAASVGVVALTDYDEYTARELCEFVGAPIASYPFVRATPNTLRGLVERFRDRPQEAVEIGRAARAWMEAYYEPGRLLQRYIDFYGSVRAGAHRSRAGAAGRAGAAADPAAVAGGPGPGDRAAGGA